MATQLDIPEGMTVTSTYDPEYGRSLEFYTGKWKITYSRSEVMEIVAALQARLEETGGSRVKQED